MPRLSYTLPASKESHEETMGVPAADDDWRRRVTIPINDEMVEALSVGEEVSVTLRGEVRGLSENEDRERKECNLEFRIARVDVNLPYDDEEESQEGFERGFKKGSHRMY